MQDELRDIAPIEPSYFLVFAAIIGLILMAAVIWTILYYRKHRKKRVLPARLWSDLKRKYMKEEVFHDPKKFYYSLNMMFREYMTLLFSEKHSALTLEESLSHLDLDKEELRELSLSLGRIYRGDYFFTEDDKRKYMVSDLDRVEAAAALFFDSVDQNI